MGCLQGIVSAERDVYSSHFAPPRCALYDALCGAKTAPELQTAVIKLC
jgi:hypothetical protein